MSLWGLARCFQRAVSALVSIGISLPFLLSVPVTAEARDCESALRESGVWIKPRSLVWTAPVERRLRRLNFSVRDFQRLFDSNFYLPILSDQDHFWLVIFEPNPDHHDKGYVVNGTRLGHQWVIERVEPSYSSHEVQYFKRLARQLEIEDEIYRIKQSLFECHEVKFEAWRQVKLWLKHRLHPQDVVDIIDHPDKPPKQDPRYSGHLDRFHLSRRVSPSKNLRVVVEKGNDCPHTIVTAYEDE